MPNVHRLLVGTGDRLRLRDSLASLSAHLSTAVSMLADDHPIDVNTLNSLLCNLTLPIGECYDVIGPILDQLYLPNREVPSLGAELPFPA